MTTEFENSPPESDFEERSHNITANLESDWRMIAAYEAALAVASEVTLESVLQRIVDVARTVGLSRYAALGVAREDGRLTQFITSGVTDEERAFILEVMNV